MSTHGLPTKVDALLRDHLKSFEQLEVLLLLRARSSESLTPEAAASELRLDPERIQDAMSGLETSGLLHRTTVEPPSYQYRSANMHLEAAVDELVIAYRERRAAVMSQMSTNAIERIRSGSLKAWADAFIIRRRKDDG